MSDDPLRALARANPFPNDTPVTLPEVTVAPRHGFTRVAWTQRGVVVVSLALGASLGWGLIATIIDPAEARPNRCVVVGAQVVESRGVCIVGGP
jgi:hypothetical protein